MADQAAPLRGQGNRRVEYGRRRTGLGARIWSVVEASGCGAVLTYGAGSSLQWRGTSSNIVVTPECGAILDDMSDGEWVEIFGLADAQARSQQRTLTERTRTERYAALDDERGYCDDADNKYYDIRATLDEREQAIAWLECRRHNCVWPEGSGFPCVPACVAAAVPWDLLSPGLWDGYRSVTWGDILSSMSARGPRGGVSAATYRRDYPGYVGIHVEAA